MPPQIVVPAEKRNDSLAEVFYGIVENESTGELSISTKKKSVFFSFYKGQVVFVEECTLGDTIAQFFVKQGLLSTKQYSEAIQLATDQFVFNEDKLLCDIVVQLGFLTKRQVQAAYVQRIRAKIIEAMGWFEYSAAFDESIEDLDSGEVAPIRLAPLIYTGIRSFYHESQLTDHFHDALTETVNLRAPIDEIAADFDLESIEKDFIGLCDKRLPLAAVIEASRLTPLHAWQLMYMLKISQKVAFTNTKKATGTGIASRISDQVRKSSPNDVAGSPRPKVDTEVPKPRTSPQAPQTTRSSFYPECVLVRPTSAKAPKDEEQTVVRKKGYSGSQIEDHPSPFDSSGPATEENRNGHAQARKYSELHNPDSKPVNSLRSVDLLRKTLSKSRGRGKVSPRESNGQRSAEELWRSGKRHLDAQHMVKARDEFRRANELAPEQPAYRMYYLWAAKNAADETGIDDISLADIKSAAESQVRVEEHQAFAYYLLGRLALLDNNESIALKCFNRSIKYDPSIRDAQRYYRILSRRYK